MEIQQIKFINYRNLNDLMIQFPSKKSFIIGENGVGKSNVLDALNKIFTYGKFADSDFTEPDKEIQLEVGLSLIDEEIGAFDEYVDPTDYSKINLIVKQAIDDTSFKVYHKETQEEISSRLLRNIVFIYYDSLRNPKTELSFDKDKGSGSLLYFLVKHFLEEKEEFDESYVKKDKLADILSFLNQKINMLQIIKKNSISVDINSNNLQFINKIFQLYDNQKIELKKSGYGVQFSILVIFSLFEKLIEVTNKAKKNGQTIEKINCILAFDEPEIHLHPFAQKSLIKDLINIASGNDKGFNDIIEEFFGIKSFSAQLLIVSHSDRIISGDYKNIVRLYGEGNNVCAISGEIIHKEHVTELKKYDKHLQKQFPYFCEALFSRKAVFVEGESEFGAIRTFARKLNVDLDSKGVSVINVAGEGSFYSLLNVFSYFKIECLGLKDRDVYERNKQNGTSTSMDDVMTEEGKLILTDRLNFEFEIVEAINDFDKFYEAVKIEDNSFNSTLQKGQVNNFIKKFNYPTSEYNKDLKWQECNSKSEKKLFLLVALTSIKGITAGAMIADVLEKEEIPSIYKKIIEGLEK